MKRRGQAKKKAAADVEAVSNSTEPEMKLDDSKVTRRRKGPYLKNDVTLKQELFEEISNEGESKSYYGHEKKYLDVMTEVEEEEVDGNSEVPENKSKKGGNKKGNKAVNKNSAKKLDKEETPKNLKRGGKIEGGSPSKKSRTETKTESEKEGHTSDNKTKLQIGQKKGTKKAPEKKKTRSSRALGSDTNKNDNAPKSGAGKEKETSVNKKKKNEFEVLSILDSRVKRGKMEFLIRWNGYDSSEDSWEPEKNLNCPQLLTDFKNKKK